MISRALKPETVTGVIHRDEAFDNLVSAFIDRGATYYLRQFKRIERYGWRGYSFNPAAALFGPIWASARGLSGLFWFCFLTEMLGVVLISMGLWGDLGSEFFARADRLEAQSLSRLEAAETALAEGVAHAPKLFESARAIAEAAESVRERGLEAGADGPVYLIFGIMVVLLSKILAGLLANHRLEVRFTKWRADRTIRSGFDARIAIGSLLFMLACYLASVLRFSIRGAPEALSKVPVTSDLRISTARWLDQVVETFAQTFDGIFTGITTTIRVSLDLTEFVLVATPWPVVMAIIVILAKQIAGWRVVFVTLFAFVYLALFDYWEKSMATVALLGTAAFICVVIGIPLGILSARYERFSKILRPVLDLMQTMPAFVYLIPVIALFGIGKPAGIIATIVFGMPPVVRLTALGLKGVPVDVREAAMAFGATRWFLLFKVDLPLAMPSIMTGVNQTILMCLSMVVIASLIGAKGLGSEVLSALQYAAVGEGLLAGLAILVCAIVIDRIVQGKR